MTPPTDKPRGSECLGADLERAEFARDGAGLSLDEMELVRSDGLPADRSREDVRREQERRGPEQR